MAKTSDRLELRRAPAAPDEIRGRFKLWSAGQSGRVGNHIRPPLAI